MRKARYDEIKGLLDRGTFKAVLEKNLPSDANIMPARFVFALKSTDDGEVKFKARYIICENRDKYKDMMVHTSPTIQSSSTRLVLAIS